MGKVSWSFSTQWKRRRALHHEDRYVICRLATKNAFADSAQLEGMIEEGEGGLLILVAFVKCDRIARVRLSHKE